MSKISGGGRPPGNTPPPPTDLNTKEGAQKFRQAAGKEKVPSKVVDSFERAAPQLNQQLRAMASKVSRQQLQFNSQALAQLAGMFAAVMKQNPKADRKERARLFARTILEHQKMGKLLEGASEQDLEAMFDTIAQQLDSSPVLAQLVDEITESSRKINLG